MFNTNDMQIAFITLGKDWYIHELHRYQNTEHETEDEGYVEYMQQQIDWFTKLLEEKRTLVNVAFNVRQEVFGTKDEENEDEEQKDGKEE